jgi:hypothetical protein
MMDQTSVTLIGGAAALLLVWAPSAFKKTKSLFAPDSATAANNALSAKMLHFFYLAQLPEIQASPTAVEGLQSVLSALTEYKPTNPTTPTPAPKV